MRSRCCVPCERGRSVVYSRVWPGVRRAGLRQSLALTPGRGGAQRSRLDISYLLRTTRQHVALSYCPESSDRTPSAWRCSYRAGWLRREAVRLDRPRGRPPGRRANTLTELIIGGADLGRDHRLGTPEPRLNQAVTAGAWSRGSATFTNSVYKPQPKGPSAYSKEGLWPW